MFQEHLVRPERTETIKGYRACINRTQEPPGSAFGWLKIGQLEDK